MGSDAASVVCCSADQQSWRQHERAAGACGRRDSTQSASGRFVPHPGVQAMSGLPEWLWCDGILPVMTIAEPMSGCNLNFMAS